MKKDYLTPLALFTVFGVKNVMSISEQEVDVSTGDHIQYWDRV